METAEKVRIDQGEDKSVVTKVGISNKSILTIELDLILSFIFLAALSLFFVFELALSLQWRMVHDTPLLHYVAFLIDRFGYVPYKEIFETSMPGSFLFHLGIGKVFGYSDYAFRLVDVFWLLTLLATSWGILRSFGWRTAWAGAALFGVTYLRHGPSMSLQKDYVGILPLALAVLIAFYTTDRKYLVRRTFFIGFLFGIAACIKPHLSLGLPLILLFLCFDHKSRVLSKSFLLLFIKLCTIATIGFILPLSACLLWLYRLGALGSFWEMFSQYLPLHLGLTGYHHTIYGVDWIDYLIISFQLLGGLAIWIAPAALGVFIALFEGGLSLRQRRRTLLLLSLVVAYSVYPVLAGQFWLYHWMPFQFFVVLVSALVFVRPLEPRKRIYPLLLILLISTIAIRPAKEFLTQVRGLELSPPNNGRVDEIASYLSANLADSDQVQPIDWTGGAVHAMLRAEVKLSTSFLYSYHFFHHVSEPMIQKLRERMVDQFARSQPRLVVEVLENRPWVSGLDTSRDFDQLERILKTEYRIALRGDQYLIHERIQRRNTKDG